MIGHAQPTKFSKMLCFAQALRTKPLPTGQQGVHADAQFLLLPLPGRGVQPVGSSGHVPGVGVAPDRRRPPLLPAGRKVGAAPLHGAAFRPGDGAADVGEPGAGPGHAGGRGGDERAGEAGPDRKVHHQGHHVCFPVRLLGWESWRNQRWTRVSVSCCEHNHACATIEWTGNIQSYIFTVLYVCVHIYTYMYVYLLHSHIQHIPDMKINLRRDKVMYFILIMRRKTLYELTEIYLLHKEGETFRTRTGLYCMT